MKNMVWKYCRSISPEWKQQVWRARRQAVTRQWDQGSTLSLIHHVTSNASQLLLASCMKWRLQ